MAATNHALLSPSAAHRWLNCPPSAKLAAQMPGKTSIAAEEGTAAHVLAEHKLKRLLRRRSNRPVSSYDTDTMEECTDDYVSFVQEKLEEAKAESKDPRIFVEQHLNLSPAVPDGFGTADCLIVSDKHLWVIDFKYGTGVLVEAENNPQLMIYALGAISALGQLYPFDTVSLCIFQPRRENVSCWDISRKDLEEWGNKVLKPKAALAFSGGGSFTPGSWCEFCSIAPKCRARAIKQLQIAKYDFKLPPVLKDEEIAKLLAELPDFVSWANQVLSYATEAAIHHGKHWPGFKVVAGRAIRKYKDQDAVIEAATAAGYTDIFDKKLIPLTAMEKLMGKENFKTILGTLIVKPAGKPTLVPESDKRPPINTDDVKKEFTEE